MQVCKNAPELETARRRFAAAGIAGLIWRQCFVAVLCAVLYKHHFVVLGFENVFASKLDHLIA
jgi:hypothetical protein